MPLVRPSLAFVLLALASLLSSAATAREPRHRAEGEARELYKKGMTHYEVGEFDTAIDEFKRAYELTSAPGLLFNIAQVYRTKKDPEQALYFYKSYLRRMPDAPNKGDVVALIHENEKLLEEQQAQKRLEPPPPVTPPPAGAPSTMTPSPPSAPSLATQAAPPPPPKPRPWRAELWSGVALAAVGLGAVAAGGAMAARAASDNSKLDRANAQGDVPWDATQQQLYRDGQNAGTASIVLFAAGGALAATGAVLGALGLRDRAYARNMALVPTTTGATVVMSCEF